MKRLLFATLLATLAMSVAALENAPSEGFPDDGEVRKILVDRIDTRHQGVGIVVGLVDGSARRVVAYGSFDNDSRKVDGDTLFEIGSTTKVFTALLLADAVARGEVSLDDPIGKFLPVGVKAPERGRKITLRDLASHTSGLPRLPSNLVPADMANPYAGYTTKQLYEFLSTYELSRDPGAQYEYSNLGAGLLGHLLELRAAADYETLVRTRIASPLKMTSTAIALGAPLQSRLAPGHDQSGKRVPNWDLPALAGAGALRSTANDLLSFVSAAISDSPLTAAFASTLKPRHATSLPGTTIALGWHVTSSNGREIVWHNGGTGGYRSYIGFDPRRRIGVVVLANMFTENGVDDIGQHLLDPSAPLASAQKERHEIAVDASTLDRYVGLYELAPNFILTVTREGNRLFSQATGQPKVELFCEAPREFFLKVVDAQITFIAGESGRAQSIVLHQGGRDMPAKRIEGELPVQKERKAIALGGELLDRYVGRYRLSPDFIIAITREGDRLFLQATGQPKLELFAEAEREFFLTVVDAQVSFTTDSAGRATTMVLHQNGMNMPGARIE
ncbi:MAG: serine hydrolase [Acidobacteria bacterium]|nr:serine hydrolase [Acidobacteriota bacterium]